VAFAERNAVEFAYLFQLSAIVQLKAHHTSAPPELRTINNVPKLSDCGPADCHGTNLVREVQSVSCTWKTETVPLPALAANSRE